MTTFFTHTTNSVGDNMWSLQYLRKQAILYPQHRFVHAVPYHLLAPLIDVVADLRNLSLIDSNYKPHYSKDIWVNSGNFSETHPDKTNVVKVLIDFYARFSNRNGMESALRHPEDLLYDYPALDKAKYTQNFDFLIVNSKPMSGQFTDVDAIDDLIGELVDKGHSVVTTSQSRHNVTCTELAGLSLTQIGNLSRNCRNILGIATGPMWATFNVWNAELTELRLLLSKYDTIFMSPNTEHASTVEAARVILRDRGLL
jgi:hypothetical protein